MSFHKFLTFFVLLIQLSFHWYFPFFLYIYIKYIYIKWYDIILRLKKISFFVPKELSKNNGMPQPQLAITKVTPESDALFWLIINSFLKWYSYTFIIQTMFTLTINDTSRTCSNIYLLLPPTFCHSCSCFRVIFSSLFIFICCFYFCFFFPAKFFMPSNYFT